MIVAAHRRSSLAIVELRDTLFYYKCGILVATVPSERANEVGDEKATFHNWGWFSDNVIRTIVSTPRTYWSVVFAEHLPHVVDLYDSNHKYENGPYCVVEAKNAMSEPTGHQLVCFDWNSFDVEVDIPNNAHTICDKLVWYEDETHLYVAETITNRLLIAKEGDNPYMVVPEDLNFERVLLTIQSHNQTH